MIYSSCCCVSTPDLLSLLAGSGMYNGPFLPQPARSAPMVNALSIRSMLMVFIGTCLWELQREFRLKNFRFGI